MKPFLIAAALLVSTVSASWHGAVSTQYQHLDPHSHTYSYGYADPNSQKHESRGHDGTTRGSYSYVDGHGHVQSVSYTADPHHGFNAVGTNLPQASPVHHAAPVYAASHAAYVPYAHHPHGIHIPVLTHGGVPVDTPEVQHAKAAHAAAHAAAAHGHHLYKRSIYGGPWAYAGAAHVPLTHGGVPVDTPDVQAAKAEHYAAHAKALGQAAHAHGAPIDTPEVQHAKSAHYAAHAAARSGHALAPISHGHAAHGYHVPVIHNGVPVDTPEVQHAKAAHYAALSQAGAHSSSHGSWDHGHYDGHYDGQWDAGHDSHAHSYATGYAHKGPIHIPVIHNGVPVEPAEVQHARASHLNALAAASHGAGHHGGGGHHGGAGYYGGGHQEDDGQYHSHYDHY